MNILGLISQLIGIQTLRLTDPLIAYLQNDQLLEDRKEADIIKRKAPSYWLSKEGSLYKRSFSGPYLLCVHPDLVNNLLYEIHEGICGSHTGG